MGQAPNDCMDIEVRIVAELDRRLAEDDAAPNDTIAWETIKADALALWQH